MKLAILHPEVAFRDCADCLRFVYDDEGRPALWRGQKIPRHAGARPACERGLCPKGSPDAGLALTEQNERAWRHHRECEAVGSFPDDPIVRRNAYTIQQAERAAQAVLRSEQRKARSG